MSDSHCWSPPAISGLAFAIPTQHGPAHAPVKVPPVGGLGSKE
jgi:hypothetical protein